MRMAETGGSDGMWGYLHGGREAEEDRGRNRLRNCRRGSREGREVEKVPHG